MQQQTIARPVDLSQERDIELRLQKARGSDSPFVLWIIFMLILVIAAILLIYFYSRGDIAFLQ